MEEFISKYLFHSLAGAIHLLSSVFALYYGTVILSFRKGDTAHKKNGKRYLISMLVLLATSFMIYRISGTFGIFHYAALFTGVNLFLGMIPLWLKKPKNWFFLHLNFMYWSVIGLYMAFASEILTRTPMLPFYVSVFVASGLVMLTGLVFFRYKVTEWRNSIKSNNK